MNITFTDDIARRVPIKMININYIRNNLIHSNNINFPSLHANKKNYGNDCFITNGNFRILLFRKHYLVISLDGIISDKRYIPNVWKYMDQDPEILLYYFNCNWIERMIKCVKLWFSAIDNGKAITLFKQFSMRRW